MKTCIKCGNEKAESEFSTGRNRCKVCRNATQRKFRSTERGKASLHKYNTSEKGRAANRKHRSTEKFRAAARKAWSKENKKPIHRIKSKLLSRLYNFLIKGRDTKLNRETMGCTRDELRARYESLFKPGMTWENYGKEWESDHIKEMKTFDLFNEETHKECMHYSNLQPQWKTLNCRNIH